MIDFKKEAQAIREEIVALRRDIHMNPEPSEQEFRTADVAAREMEALGFEIRRDACGELPSVIAVMKGGKPGPVVALRADMDALRLVEKNDAPYCSKNEGVMHACGHDAHVAMLYGAARLLAAHRDEIPGTVKFIFEPAEENIGGAQFMVENGVMDDVDAVFGMHVENRFPVGSIGIRCGAIQASSDRLIVHIKGKSGHGAYPHVGVDAVVIASHFVVALQSMLTREKDSSKQAIVSFGMIHGGASRNIICDDVELNGIVRTLDPEVREQINRRIDELLKYLTAAFGGDYTLERQRSHPSVINGKEMFDFTCETAKKVLGEDAVNLIPDPLMTCESFGYFSQLKPSCYFNIGTGNAAKGFTEALHNSAFDLDEDALPLGAAMHATLALDYLTKNA